ncbi:hypothetical protein KKG83_04045 [Candidatus Micrarchaeota archaeon]|nr:hypothetical protein [Candidatus Micrarchaeota archaeon]MBU2476617.1 hypothetical protein [Candidatus Micrarchaeota archaeon]
MRKNRGTPKLKPNIAGFIKKQSNQGYYTKEINQAVLSEFGKKACSQSAVRAHANINNRMPKITARRMLKTRRVLNELKIKFPHEVLKRLQRYYYTVKRFPSLSERTIVITINTILNNPKKPYRQLHKEINQKLKQDKSSHKGITLQKTMLELLKIAYSPEELLEIERKKIINRKETTGKGRGSYKGLEKLYPYIVRAIENYSKQGMSASEIRRELRFKYGKEHDHTEHTIRKYIEKYRQKKRKKQKKVQK